jgi:hypothetical protein
MRQLQGREAYPVCIEGLEGRQMDLLLDPIPGALPFHTGNLVEVEAPDTLYLGEVTANGGSRLRVHVEHALDKSALAAIRKVWTGQDVD